MPEEQALLIINVKVNTLSAISFSKEATTRGQSLKLRLKCHTQLLENKINITKLRAIITK